MTLAVDEKFIKSKKCLKKNPEKNEMLKHLTAQNLVPKKVPATLRKIHVINPNFTNIINKYEEQLLKTDGQLKITEFTMDNSVEEYVEFLDFSTLSNLVGGSFYEQYSSVTKKRVIIL